ncbi:MAG TPA: hypothetical protein PKV98_17325 [Burkholderiaceae bacterium]|nr:hypothetical protein [Burkholderiaceae bacterium]
MTREFRRPLGEISTRVVELAAAREISYMDAASTLQLSRRHASVTVYTLATRGHLEEVDRRPVQGARKPVPIYRAADPAAEVIPAILLLDWPR